MKGTFHLQLWGGVGLGGSFKQGLIVYTPDYPGTQCRPG